MILIQEPYLSVFTECPYIEDRECRYEYFFAFALSEEELDVLLEKGWRKFGTYFFRPRCPQCEACVPIRIRTGSFKPTKSQRRVMNRGRDIKVKYLPLAYRDEIYEVYRDHSYHRFGRETDVEEFIRTFYTRSCPAIQTEYYYGDELFAAGFIDRSAMALSSVYFVFKDEYKDLSPGTFGAICEIEHAASMGLSYYYLGYYIQENRSMSYKNRFHPHETYNWEDDLWSGEDEIG